MSVMYLFSDMSVTCITDMGIGKVSCSAAYQLCFLAMISCDRAKLIPEAAVPFSVLFFFLAFAVVGACYCFLGFGSEAHSMPTAMTSKD